MPSPFRFIRESPDSRRVGTSFRRHILRTLDIADPARQAACEASEWQNRAMKSSSRGDGWMAEKELKAVVGPGAQSNPLSATQRGLISRRYNPSGGFRGYAASNILRMQQRSGSITMASFPLVSATAMLGSGFRAESLEKAISLGARMIGCDAGSTDPGPGPLAIGICMFSAAAVKRDTEIMVTRAMKAGIPLIIGSAGTSGSDTGLAWMVDIVR